MMEFRILGPLEVVDDGRPLELGATQAADAAGRAAAPSRRDRLADAADAASCGARSRPASAAKAIQGYVSGLRRILGAETIVTRTRGYVLAPGRLDADAFERLAADAQARMAGDPAAAAELLREALALWRGEPLQGIEFEGLARNEAERLGEQRLAVLERRVEADLALGRDAELVAELQELVAAHPLRERLRGHLMLALYRSGRQADALALYRDTRAFLADELGLEPGEELRRLERLMLAQSPELDAPRLRPRRTRPRRARREAGAEPAGAGWSASWSPRSRRGALTSGSTPSRCTRCSTRLGSSPRSSSGTAARVDAFHGRLRDRRLRASQRCTRTTRCVRCAPRPSCASGPPRSVRSWSSRPVRVAVRVGVDSGEVYVAAGARRQAFATGEALHVATGLKALAADGEVLLGDRTRRLAGASVRAEPLGAVELEGRAAAVEAWRLLGLGHARAARGAAAGHRVRRARGRARAGCRRARPRRARARARGSSTVDRPGRASASRGSPARRWPARAAPRPS